MRKVLQSNAITSASYKFSIIEKRLLYIIFEDINRLHPFEVDSIVTNNLEYKIVLTHAQVEEIVNLTHLSYVLEAFLSLRQKSFFLRNNSSDGFVEVGIIASSNFLDNKTIEVTISHQILPYLTGLAKNFTEIEIPVVLSFRSYYSQRFYELCRMWQNVGVFYLEVEELRSMLRLPQSFPTKKITQSILCVAQTEMEESFHRGASDLYFEWAPDLLTKSGKSITRLIFRIITSSKRQLPSGEHTELSKSLTIRALFQRIFANRSEKSYLSNICNHIALLHKSEMEELIHMLSLVAEGIPSSSEKQHLKSMLKDKFSL